MIALQVDRALLAVARRVLLNRGFRIEEADLEGLEDTPWLIAEDEYFVMGVAACVSADDLVVIEGFLSAALGGRLEADRASLGAKVWDAYVVLLATTGAEERGRPDIVGLEYNTRSLRRIICLGTAPYDDAVETALAPFLPLRPPLSGGLPSAFDLLVRQLVLNGIPAEAARAAVTSYRSAETADGT